MVRVLNERSLSELGLASPDMACGGGKNGQGNGKRRGERLRNVK